MPPRLSLVMIVKDEESCLARALSSLEGVVDEMIVVDTGSTDNSREIARSFGAQVYEHVWKDDFAEARNVALAHATGDWVLQLDGDEELAPIGAEELEALLSDEGVDGYLCLISLAASISEIGPDRSTFQAMRLFRRTPAIKYVYAIHENPLVDAARTGDCHLTIVHFGPFTDQVKDRHTRNMRLLEKAISEEPDTPYMHYKLGGQLMLTKAWPEAYMSFAEAVGLVRDPTTPYLPSMFRDMAWCQLELEDYEGADETLADALAYFPDFTDLYFVKAVIATKEGRTHDAAELLGKCLEMGDPDPHVYWSLGGTGSWRAAAGLQEHGT